MDTTIRHSDQKRSRKNKTIDIDDDVDRISRLPDHIIHYILSFLSTREVVRVCVLSKAWCSFFNSFPMSDFFDGSVQLYCQNHVGPDGMLKFLSFVHNSLLRQCRQNSSIPKFRFSVLPNWSSVPQLVNLADQCIQLAMRYGVKELDLQINLGYQLSPVIFSAKDLAVCRLAWCNLNFPQGASTNWPSLRDLCFKQVSISDKQIINNLISTCPFIEKLSLEACLGLNHLRLSGFTKLNEVKVMSSCMEKIEIDLLSLQTFYFSYGGYDETHLDLISCKNLESLQLKFYYTSYSKRIQDLVSKFPALKVLVLETIDQRSIKILSQRLEKLQLSSGYRVERMNIDAPRLQSFKYDFRNFPSSFSLNKTSLEEVALKLDFHDSDYKSSIIEHLRDALVNFKQIKLHTLDIECDWRNFDAIPEIVSNNTESVSPDIKHLKLKVNLKSDNIDAAMIGNAYEALVEGVIRVCHSESLLLKSGWGTDKESVRFLCKRLMRSYPCKISVA